MHYQMRCIQYEYYQPKEERAYRVVTKNVPYDGSTDLEEFNTKGHKIRNIINGRHRITTKPINSQRENWQGTRISDFDLFKEVNMKI